jgi:hypothetical protein
MAILLWVVPVCVCPLPQVFLVYVVSVGQGSKKAIFNVLFLCGIYGDHHHKTSFIQAIRWWQQTMMVLMPYTLSPHPHPLAETTAETTRQDPKLWRCWLALAKIIQLPPPEGAMVDAVAVVIFARCHPRHLRRHTGAKEVHVFLRMHGGDDVLRSKGGKERAHGVTNGLRWLALQLSWILTTINQSTRGTTREGKDTDKDDGGNGGQKRARGKWGHVRWGGWPGWCRKRTTAEEDNKEDALTHAWAGDFPKPKMG